VFSLARGMGLDVTTLDPQSSVSAFVSPVLVPAGRMFPFLCWLAESGAFWLLVFFWQVETGPSTRRVLLSKMMILMIPMIEQSVLKVPLLQGYAGSSEIQKKEKNRGKNRLVLFDAVFGLTTAACLCQHDCRTGIPVGMANRHIWIGPLPKIANTEHWCSSFSNCPSKAGLAGNFRRWRTG
jgi:hypothetical protein